MTGDATEFAETAPEPGAGPSLARGVAVIAETLKTLPGAPGVYRMTDADGAALYVGKARNLKRRVVAYTRPDRMPMRLQRMIAATAAMEIVRTHTEVEALLLESNLIKRLAPRYNVLLRDDKSFPYILLTGGTDWPQLLKHRGAQSRDGEYFGPFASAGAVNGTLATLHRAFPLRNCSDAIFNNRTRPCLQYQIKRCTAPCVGRIDAQTYGEIVDQARGFLTGRSRDLQQALSARMQEASDALDFETAAAYRDRIRALTQIHAHQDINLSTLGNTDVIAVHQDGGLACVQVFFFRSGQNFGNRSYYPAHTAGFSPSELIGSFIGQFYSRVSPPPLVLVSDLPDEAALIEQALGVRAGRKVALSRPVRGARRKAVEHARANAREAHARRLSESVAQRRLLNALCDTFGLDAPPARIEIYDNSHISGSNPVGAMVVAGPEGFAKAAYRKFNIRTKGIAAGDDYAMMREVIGRRFRRALAETPERGGAWPDLLLIDGGRGQLNAVNETLDELGIDDLAVVAISKGPDRDAGRERFHIAGRAAFMLKPGDPVLYYLQRLRDEAHRFAIGSHRARRARDITRSPLDDVAGVGAARKRALLHHFGSAQAVSRAGLADLEAVAGISRPLAKKIHDHFSPDE